MVNPISNLNINFGDFLNYTGVSFEPIKTFKSLKSNDFFWKNPKLLPTLTKDIEIIKKNFVGLNTDNDVANILELPVGQLLYILYTQEKKYTSFNIKKKSGKSRLIESPNKSIKILQNKVKPLIEAHYRVKKPVHGFVGNGKSIITNAQQHKKKKYVLNLDLQDFFHSINFGRVQGIFKNNPFNMGNSAATVLAQLCTYNKRLPQGACTSPVLSNLASATLDKRLIQIAKKFKLTYTRYADDITFSSNRHFSTLIVQKELLANGDFKYRVGDILDQAIIKSGFTINHKKTRLQHKSQRQEVTGLIVNEGVNINRKFIRKTRAMINEWSKNLLEAEKRFIKIRYHASDTALSINKLDGSIYKRAVYGNLSFIKMVKGDDHSPYLTLCKKVLELDTNPPPFIAKLKGTFEMYDIFICHASEDKEKVAIPLYEALEAKNIPCFIDSIGIRWGDSIVGKINTALQRSRFVLAIISEDSLSKSWPMKELNAVLSTEINCDERKLVGLIIGEHETVKNKLPILLSDKRFITYNHETDDINDIVKQIEELLAQ